jgi:hypothetical protein
MAIQLSERDNLIFRFIQEHEVLLEKHIAWFISCAEKPVLIRDRLRKLFYLDYLLCERHGGKLPWWTTPTKPLVYMLSPMTRQLTNAEDSTYDLSDCETQRHLLEVANLRMLFLQDQNAGLISDFQWTTIRKTRIGEKGLDATVSFKRNGTVQKVGIVNHPTMTAEDTVNAIQSAIQAGTIETAWIISRDEAFQRSMQQALKASTIAHKVAFTTHQEIYKAGVARAKFQACTTQYVPTVTDAISIGWPAPTTLTPAQAF